MIQIPVNPIEQEPSLPYLAIALFLLIVVGLPLLIDKWRERARRRRRE